MLTLPVNHKPIFTGESRKTSVLPKSPNTFSLSIEDDEDNSISTYKYDGQRYETKRSFAFIFDTEDKSCTVEPVKENFSFNLCSAPWAPDKPAQLAKDYPQVPAMSESVDHGNDEAAAYSDQEPDGSNPFDYRHYLDSQSPSPTPSAATPAIEPSNPTTLVPFAPSLEPPSKRQKHSPPSRVAKKAAPPARGDWAAATRGKGRATAKKPQKPAPKSEEFVYSSSSEAADSPPKPAPTIQAPESESEDDAHVMDSGGLEIDFGDAPASRQKKQPGFNLLGSSHGGPISLRSAASSPSSRIPTPQRHAPQDGVTFDLGETEGYEGEDDGGDSDEEQFPKFTPGTQHTAKVSVQDDSDGDEDVEPMSLGPPAHEPNGFPGNVTAEVDAEDDFEAEMLQGLADEDDDMLGPTVHEEYEESSESEAD